MRGKFFKDPMTHECKPCDRKFIVNMCNSHMVIIVHISIDIIATKYVQVFNINISCSLLPWGHL